MPDWGDLNLVNSCGFLKLKTASAPATTIAFLNNDGENHIHKKPSSSLSRWASERQVFLIRRAMEFEPSMRSVIQRVEQGQRSVMR